jgi:hypothetical protein
MAREAAAALATTAGVETPVVRLAMAKPMPLAPSNRHVRAIP